MKYRHRILAACCLALAWLVPQAASAFYILSPKSEPCHERLMLGALGAADPPFGSAETEGAKLLDLFASRLQARGMPAAEATEAFVDETSERYGFSGRSRAEQFVLSSFVAGVRQPDTDGLSVIKFNETRSLHLQDENQPKHSLRQTGHDYETGDEQAIERARQVVLDHLMRAYESWDSDDGLFERARWSFPYYGEVEVSVLTAAFELGRAAHVVQDAYSHALRDDEMQIVAVGNFVDSVEQRYFEPRDGPAHSDRLDECNTDESAFDEMRVIEARDATVGILAATALALRQAPSRAQLEEIIDAPLDEVFALRGGCSFDNDYCGTDWLELSRSDVTEPYNLSLCAAPSSASSRRTTGVIATAVVLFCAAWRVFKSRSRRSTA